MNPDKTPAYSTRFILNEEIIQDKVYLVITCQDQTVDWSIGYGKIIKACLSIQERIRQLGGEFVYSLNYGKEITLKLKLPMKDLETARLYKEKFYKDLPASINGWLNTYA
ncbi:MAG: hypothetical protein N2Z79_00110 [Candidatus Omnitrophica bacterium]|nr:hypothetical protein [Candidatus Omnitrophota bacterium]